MELDQFFFKKVIALLQRIRPRKNDPALLERQATLSSVQSRLTILARALSGKPVQIASAESTGGISGNTYLLPPAFSVFAARNLNEQFYIWRLCYLDIRSAMTENADITACLASMLEEFPSLREFTDLLIAASLITGSLGSVTDFYMLSPSVGQTMDIPANENPARDEIKTERQGKTRENIRSHVKKKSELDDYTLMHSFEKVETAEEFQGNWRDMDGDDNLDEHSDALNEMDLRDTVRTDTPVHSVLKTEFFSGTSAGDVVGYDSGGIAYPEWDYKKRTYKQDFCRVFDLPAGKTVSDFANRALRDHEAVVRRLRRRMNLINNELQQVRRQTSGEEPDLDRLIDNFADMRAGKTPDENVYIARRKRSLEFTVSILVDLSLSTDSFTGGQRIIDVEKKAISIFGQILHESDVRFSIAGFCSRTRNQCNFVNVKDVSDSWEKAKTRIGHLSPEGYTRIGPAIRHATSNLNSLPGAKWIILLSDGKPNDFDRYEGRYGIEDVKKAIVEARRDGIRSYALAIEASAKYYLPLMFGQGSYRILPTPELLPEALGDFYTQLRQMG
ncbi:MAG: VWA domain-containing protein [Leptospirales bacterium]|nr:VWA domain-containing protein [Leptospirales bacterium]